MSYYVTLCAERSKLVLRAEVHAAMSNGNQQGPEHIEIVAEPPAAWQPVAGPEVTALLNHTGLQGDTLTTVRNEAASILARCIPPTLPTGQDTGLVIGYVQSGKTMSFTTVAAMARDNAFPIVIVIAGTSIPLTEQSRERLRRDLRVDQRDDRTWRLFHNPRLDQQDHERIRTTLADWRDAGLSPAERSTVLITVMKNHRHLENLIDVLQEVPLNGIPVLIVDDEADQAGLNNLINQGDESTTYQHLCALKNAVPQHTFLQYTATPQGPLLINLIDVLSPGFAVPLTPGPDYVGGHDIFTEQAPLVRVIPATEIPSNTNLMQEPPESLLSSMRLFFLGVASGLIRGGRGNRSMMVHPSQKIGGHQQYFNWVTAVRAAWRQALEDRPDTDPDKRDLLQEFRGSYDDLGATVPDLEPFDALSARLVHAIRRTEMWQINTSQGKTPQVDWRAAYAHILVGGQALDRGFTVEGLTVTYMPRGVGARRADTIQQRARFFGYKRPYLGYCRVFLEQDVANAFRRYVRHEEDIRHQIRTLASEGRPLDELRRAFLLPQGLAATRDSIIDVDYVRARVHEGWFSARAPHDSRLAGEANREHIDAYLDTLELVDDEGHEDRTSIQRHQVARGVSLREAYEQMLVNLRFGRLSDAQNLLGVLVVIRNYLRDHPQATCEIYHMSCGQERERALNADGEIPNLFQGANPVNPPERRGEIYPGDREIHSQTEVTIQVHRLNLLDRESRAVLFASVPNLAIWISPQVGGDVLIQEQGGTDEAGNG